MIVKHPVNVLNPSIVNECINAAVTNATFFMTIIELHIKYSKNIAMINIVFKYK